MGSPDSIGLLSRGRYRLKRRTFWNNKITRFHWFRWFRYVASLLLNPAPLRYSTRRLNPAPWFRYGFAPTQPKPQPDASNVSGRCEKKLRRFALLIERKLRPVCRPACVCRTQTGGTGRRFTRGVMRKAFARRGRFPACGITPRAGWSHTGDTR